MNIKRIVCGVMTFLVVANCSCVGFPAEALDREYMQSTQLVVERASGRFSLDIQANKTVGATTSFPLEAGERVRIRANYSPETADIDFGLITSDGLFHPLKASGGSFDQYIRVDQHGNYVLAIRNNSNVEVAVSGIVSY